MLQGAKAVKTCRVTHDADWSWVEGSVVGIVEGKSEPDGR